MHALIHVQRYPVGAPRSLRRTHAARISLQHTGACELPVFLTAAERAYLTGPDRRYHPLILDGHDEYYVAVSAD